MTTAIRTDTNLIADVRNRSDLGASLYRTDAQIRRYLNESHRRMTAKLLRLFGSGYYEATTTVETTADQQWTTMPTDMFILRNLRVTLNSDQRIDIGRADSGEIDKDTGTNGWDTFLASPRHRILGGRFYWFPTPRAVHVVTVNYVTNETSFNTGGNAILELTTGTDYIDGYWGFEQWVVLDAAMKIKKDQDEDVKDLMTEQDGVWADFSAIADMRNEQHAPRVRDSYSESNFDGRGRRRYGGGYR